MYKHISLHLPSDLVDWLDREAKKEMRSRSKQLEYILLRCAMFGGYVSSKERSEER